MVLLCGLSVLMQPAAGVLSAGSHTITYRVTDKSGNSAVCNFTVTVQDLTGPTFAGCPPALTINYGAGSCNAQVNWTPPTATDNCSGLTSIVSSHTPPVLFNYGITTVTYTAFDMAGNISICSFPVNVVDNLPPALSCKPSITVDLNTNTVSQPTQVTVNAGDIVNTVSDNSCFYSFSPTSRLYDCSNVGVPSTYALTVTDNVGNSSTCVTTVVVRDVTPPLANCATISGGTNMINLNSSGSVTVYANNMAAVLPDISMNAMSTDNCTIATYEVSKDGVNFAPSVSFGCFEASTLANPQTQTLTLRVVHKLPVGLTVPGPNDFSICTKVVTIKDVTPPTLNKPADITLSNYCDLINNPSPLGTAPPAGTATGVATGSDVCSGALFYPNNGISYTDVTVLPVNCPVKKIIDRTWKATDASGNMTTGIQRITLQDNTKPTFNNPPVIPSLMYTSTDVNCLKVYSLPVGIWATDNCVGPIAYSYSIDYDPNTPGPGVNPYTPGDQPITPISSLQRLLISVPNWNNEGDILCYG
ncbi:MAG: HYR domain-containing protein [Lewinellaceae bacterium]|nr:HYR domain-containing protein [Lewinellaceae bacterium]